MSSRPVIERLTRRLAECPGDFLAEPRLPGRGGEIEVAAVVADLLCDLGAARALTDAEALVWEKAQAADRNRLRLTLVACWLCHDPWLREARCWAAKVKGWLATGLGPVSALVSADLFVADPDRREELARSLVAALALVPEGETPEQAADRLKAISSVERARIIEQTRARQERARKLREQMEAERAREAAARCTSE